MKEDELLKTFHKGDCITTSWEDDDNGLRRCIFILDHFGVSYDNIVWEAIPIIGIDSEDVFHLKHFGIYDNNIRLSTEEEKRHLIRKYKEYKFRLEK